MLGLHTRCRNLDIPVASVETTVINDRQILVVSGSTDVFTPMAEWSASIGALDLRPAYDLMYTRYFRR